MSVLRSLVVAVINIAVIWLAFSYHRALIVGSVVVGTEMLIGISLISIRRPLISKALVWGALFTILLLPVVWFVFVDVMLRLFLYGP